MGKSFYCCNSCTLNTNELDKKTINLNRESIVKEKDLDYEDKKEAGKPIGYNQEALFTKQADDNASQEH